uniref:Uncharacterized protein n=1 Tax=Ralstonia solanacearum TaxID=305 RepID=A0A0S4WBG8_RALSL|nr:protein of unknown function [Ralstonia solanacearum]
MCVPRSEAYCHTQDSSCTADMFDRSSLGNIGERRL